MLASGGCSASTPEQRGGHEVACAPTLLVEAAILAVLECGITLTDLTG